MFGISFAKWKWIIAALVLANIANYLYSNWGLVTVKVHDQPLSKVIRSIEWQGWVKIYTNIPLDSKVTMYVDHVPLAEAMESLAANVDVPPPVPGEDDGTTRPRRDRPGGFAAAFGGGAPGATNAAGFTPGGAPGGPGGRGGGGGGFGRRAEWNLAFFVAPTSAGVKQEISDFQTSDTATDAKVYTYGTQTQLIASDDVTTAPDPHLQSWPGIEAFNASTAAAVPQTNLAADTPPAGTPTDPPADSPPTVQTYLQDFAASANIWIMAAGSWTPQVTTPPPANSSIISALKNLVSSSHGAVTQALVLRAGRGGPRPTGNFSDGAWEDRLRNTINGLPADQRPAALDQLTKEVQFRKELQALPPEQRRQKMFQHMMERMLYADRSRLSPEKRARAYQRMVAMRQAAKAGR
jgi:hypothetical protein